MIRIDMREYIDNMLKEFPVKFHGNEKGLMMAAGTELFKEDLSKKLGLNEQELFHRTTANAFF